MAHRSVDTEGIFEDIKKNYDYDQLKRRGESEVKVELNLVAIGYNIKRYHDEKRRELENNQKSN